MFYQKDNSNRHGHIQIDLYENFNFAMHLHRDMELVWPLEGSATVITRSREESLSPGQIALILPHELHAYATPESSKLLVCVFSTDHVHTFAQMTEGLRGDRSVFPCPPVSEAVLKETFFDLSRPDILQFKAAFYAVCAQYRRCAQLSPSRTPEDSALEKLLLYVEEHYRENITLAGAANAIGYNKNYLSRCFHQATGVNFRHFINYHRIQCVCQQIQAGEDNISEIALSSGFQNLRSFNRAFQEFMGMPPRVYFGRPSRSPQV